MSRKRQSSCNCDGSIVLRSKPGPSARPFGWLALTPKLSAQNQHTALVDALSALRASLRALGSDLVVREGPLDVTVAEFAAANGVDTIMTEREVEAR